MAYHSFDEVKHALSKGETTCESLVKDYLQRIEARKNLNVFLEVFEEEALSKAQAVDKKIADGSAGKLAGMVIGLKDNIVYQNHRVSAASKILQGFESIFSATVVERLLAEDAIFIGRVNCDEFAMGSSNENSAYGNVKNPIDESRVPGGSSGGSAAAVAADLCLAALGSDTGGSIRQPASFCGVYGIKPTYGRVSRHGLIAYGSSLDQIGPLTKNADDAALLMEVMAGADEFDTTASKTEVEELSPLTPTKGQKKIVVLSDPMQHQSLDPEIKAYTEDLIEKLKEEGHKVRFERFNLLDYLVPCYNVISNAEASSNLSRYDGVHYGYRSKGAKDLETTYINTRSEGFGKEVKRRIMLGTFVLSAGYYDAYFAKAQKVRYKIQHLTKALLADADFILYPTTPNTAFELGAKTDPIEMYLQDIFTVHANLSGNPAASVPLGQHSNGLPFGIQLMANHFEEKELLRFSKWLIHNFS